MVESAEDLRETLVAMQGEIDSLRIETTHANLLLKTLDTLLGADSTDDLFTNVFSALRPVFEFSHALVLIGRSDNKDILECAASDHQALVHSQWAVKTIFRKVLDGRTVTTVSNHQLNEWADGVDGCLSRSQPALYLPLRVHSNHGLLMLLRGPGRPGFDRTHVALARKFSLLASQAVAARHASETEAESHRLTQLANRRLEDTQAALVYRANHDQLTGLPNRAYIQELVDTNCVRGSPECKMALAFVDLDNFKRVNDTYGHTTGDTLLKGVADRIRAQIRTTDLLGRISGDEFVIVLNPFEERDEITNLVDRIIAEFARPYEIDGFEVLSSASIGIAFYPTHGADYNALRHNADIAMYHAKKASKGSVAYFNNKMGKKAADRVLLEQHLQEAVHDRAFRCALQPKVAVRNRKIVGFEALARWVDTQGVIQPPATFIQVAGELGLLNQITNFIFDEIIGSLPRLDACFGTGMRFSINVSAAQACDLNFMRAFIDRIARTQHAKRFMLEVTEDAFVATGLFQSRILPLLQEAGIGVSIDDFGTGYSSLSALADITADELKIDRSFITSIHQRPRSQSILRAIESLAYSLGMYVVAEGIETEQENEYINAHTNIVCGQGYLFYKPQFIDALIEQIETSRALAANSILGLA
jgi:cyclic di-GMP phosphodiesterase Gmr